MADGEVLFAALRARAAVGISPWGAYGAHVLNSLMLPYNCGPSRPVSRAVFSISHGPDRGG